MGNVRQGITLLGIAVLGIGFAFANENLPHGAAGPAWGGFGGPVELPGAPTEPGPVAPPPAPPPAQLGTNGLPNEVKPYCPGLLKELQSRLLSLQQYGFKRLNFPAKNPIWIVQRYRALKQKLAEYSRVHLRRDNPVWVMDELIPVHAKAAANKDFGLPSVEQPPPLDSTTAKAHIDQLIADTKSYPEKWQSMIDAKLQAQLRIETLQNELKKPVAERTSDISLPIVTKGELYTVPKLETFSGDWQINAKIKKLKDEIDLLDGTFGTEGSFANVAEKQAANIELLKVTRSVFDKSLQDARIQNKDAPIPTYIQDKYKDIATVLDRNTGKINEGFAPPPEAFERIKIVEMRKDIKDLFLTLWKDANDRRIISTAKNKYGERSTPRGAIQRLFRKNDSATASGVAGSPGIDLPVGQPASNPYNPKRFANFINNMSPDQRAVFGINKLNGYVALLRQGSFAGAVGGAGDLIWQYSHGGISFKDIAATTLDMWQNDEENTKRKCIATVDPFSYSMCRTNYLKTKFLRSYMSEMGLKDNAVVAHSSNKEIEIDLSSIATKPTRGSLYKNPKTGLVYIRPEFSPRYFQGQPGAQRDEKYPTLKIDPKALPELGQGFPIERDPKSNKIIIHANTFVKESGFFVYKPDGSEEIAPPIRAEAQDFDLKHLTFVKAANNEANFNLLMQKNANLGDPCSDESKLTWMKAADAIYQAKMAECVNLKFNIFVSRDPIAQSFKEAVLADSDHKRTAIDKLVTANDNFGNCVCTMFQQRETALKPDTKVDYKCGGCVDPSTISIYGMGYSGGYGGTYGGTSNWPIGNSQNAPWGGAGSVTPSVPGGWTIPGTSPGGVTPPLQGWPPQVGVVVVAPNAGGTTPSQNQAPGNTQTHPGSFSIPSLTGPVQNSSPPPFFLY